MSNVEHRALMPGDMISYDEDPVKLALGGPEGRVIEVDGENVLVVWDDLPPIPLSGQHEQGASPSDVWMDSGDITLCDWVFCDKCEESHLLPVDSPELDGLHLAR